jgi:hypothetical protein
MPAYKYTKAQAQSTKHPCIHAPDLRDHIKFFTRFSWHPEPSWSPPSPAFRNTYVGCRRTNMCVIYYLFFIFYLILGEGRGRGVCGAGAAASACKRAGRCGEGKQTTESRQQTANSRQQTVRQAAARRQQTAGGQLTSIAAGGESKVMSGQREEPHSKLG